MGVRTVAGSGGMLESKIEAVRRHCSQPRLRCGVLGPLPQAGGLHLHVATREAAVETSHQTPEDTRLVYGQGRP